MVTLCWAVKGGSGTTVVTSTLALESTRPALLVDLDGEIDTMLGLPEPDRPGVVDWLLGDGPPTQLDDLLIDIDDTTFLLPCRLGGTDGPTASMPLPERWAVLLTWFAEWEAHSGGEVWIDGGTGTPATALASGIEQRWLVSRACYLSLRRAARSPIRPTGVLFVSGHGRQLRPKDVERSVGAPIGRRLDLTTPIVDARLADGSRVCAVIGPVGVDGASLSIRRFARSARQLAAFTDPIGVKILIQIVERRCNVVVSGATSSGKTSLLAALIATLPAHERIVVLEDTAELPIGAQHVVRLEARPPAPDGPPAIDLNDLVRTALRLRPDRLVVGEIRGPEVLGLVQAMNTGHDGSFSTCHANGPHDALLRLESLILQAAPTWPLPAIRQQLARSLDVVVHISRSRSDGKRRLVSICEVGVPNHDGEPSLVPIAELRTGERLVQVGVLQSRR